MTLRAPARARPRERAAGDSAGPHGYRRTAPPEPWEPPSITALQAELGRVLFAAAVLVLLTAGLIVIASLRRRGAHRTATVTALVAFGVALVGVLSLTLFGWESPTTADRQLFLDPLQGAWGWNSIAWRPVIDNVALFLPLGALAAAAWWRRSVVTVWLACVLLSVGIETFQYLVPTGRVANTADVVANGLGAAVGVLLAAAFGARAAARQAPARARERV